MEEEQEEGGAVTPSNEVAPAADSTNVIEPTVLEPIKPEGPEISEGGAAISEGGAKRTLEEMEGPPKEAVPMPSPARPRLNINKSDKGQIGSHRSRDSKETRCKLALLHPCVRLTTLMGYLSQWCQARHSSLI